MSHEDANTHRWQHSWTGIQCAHCCVWYLLVTTTAAVWHGRSLDHFWSHFLINLGLGTFPLLWVWFVKVFCFLLIFFLKCKYISGFVKVFQVLLLGFALPSHCINVALSSKSREKWQNHTTESFCSYVLSPFRHTPSFNIKTVQSFIHEAPGESVRTQ